MGIPDNTDDVVLVDIGASGGPHRRWRDFSAQLTALLFEPDEKAYREFSAQVDRKTYVENVALFEQPGEYAFHLCQKQEVSSVYRPNFKLLNLYPNPERFEVVETIQLKMNSLDRLFEETGLLQPS